MTYNEVLTAARGQMGPCKACPVCDGRACRNTVPGPGAKGVGDVAIRNYSAWQNVRVNMDTICESGEPDTTLEMFGHSYRIPVFAGPVGAMQLHYGTKYTDLEYNDILVPACHDAGILAFTGDGTNPAVMVGACKAVKANAGFGIPTVKPWDAGTIAEKMALVRATGAFAVAMDIDGAGLPFLKNMTPPAGSKSVQELTEIIRYAAMPFIVKGVSKTVEELRGIIADAKVPFIIKGVMTARGAQKAVEAGASAIVISNHGGRVQGGVPSTAEVLPAIAEAVKGKITILVDGGIRSGVDVFRAIALGADGVLIGRPMLTMIYGGGEEGFKVYMNKLVGELKSTMTMCGAASLKDISRDMIWLGK